MTRSPDLREADEANVKLYAESLAIAPESIRSLLRETYQAARDLIRARQKQPAEPRRLLPDQMSSQESL